MPNTKWEDCIDEMIDATTEVTIDVYSNEGAISRAGATLVTNHDYFFTFFVKNVGTEVKFAELTARILGSQEIQLYDDPNYSRPIGRTALTWTDVDSGRICSGKVYFRVKRDVTNPEFPYGIYGIVIPEGHVWNTLTWDGYRPLTQ